MRREADDSVGHGAEGGDACDQVLHGSKVRRLAEQHAPVRPALDADIEDGGPRVQPALRADLLDDAGQRVHGPTWAGRVLPAFRRGALRRGAGAAAPDAATAGCAR